MSQPRCLKAGQSYEVEMKFNPDWQHESILNNASPLFESLLANSARSFNLTIHGYNLSQSGYRFSTSLLHQDSDLPRAMQRLNFHLNTYIKKSIRTKTGVNVSGSIFKGRYKTKEIESEAHAKLAYMRVVTADKTDEDSKKSAITTPISWIATSKKRRFERPEIVGIKAKVKEHISIEFPIIPILKGTKLEILKSSLEAIKTLIEDSNLERVSQKDEISINEQSQLNSLELDNKTSWTQEGRINQSPNAKNQGPKDTSRKLESDHRSQEFVNQDSKIRQLPLTSVSNTRTRRSVEVDFLRFLSPDERNLIAILELSSKAYRKKWLEHYTTALEDWIQGKRKTPFPTGTYKLRVLHKCLVSDKEITIELEKPANESQFH